MHKCTLLCLCSECLLLLFLCRGSSLDFITTLPWGFPLRAFLLPYLLLMTLGRHMAMVRKKCSHDHGNPLSLCTRIYCHVCSLKFLHVPLILSSFLRGQLMTSVITSLPTSSSSNFLHQLSPSLLMTIRKGQGREACLLFLSVCLSFHNNPNTFLRYTWVITYLNSTTQSVRID